MRLDTTRPDQMDVALHRALAAWGEGPSNYKSGTSGEGGGAGGPALAPDATWIYRFFGTTQTWASPGGDHVASPSATTLVGDDLVDHIWSGTAVTADIQQWVDQPAANFGWLIKGGVSPKAFASRQHPSPMLHPRLTVTFTEAPPAAQEDIPLPAWALAVLALACAGALGKRRR